MRDQEKEPPPGQEPTSKSNLLGPVLYPNAYVWLVFVSAMDVIMTRIVLAFGGSEVNPVALLAIKGGGLWGLIVFKFAIIAGVIVLCEFIGRHKYGTGRWLSIFGVVISALPSLWAFVLLLTREPLPDEEPLPAGKSHLVESGEQVVLTMDAPVLVMR